MPRISSRGENMPASPIRRLVPYAELAKRKGTKVYHLNIGQPDIETAPPFMEAVKKANIKVLEYSHSAGNESYRRKLVNYYAKFNISLSHEDILITTGGSEAILFTMLACLNPDDEVIIPEPLYANYIGFAVQAGVKVVPITTYLQNNFALPKASVFESLITSRTRAILINNPANPAGSHYTKQELDALKALVQKYDLYLIADEVYKEFVYDGQKFYSVLQLEGLEDHVIMIDSVSKRYSACGARIGCLVTKNKSVYQTVLKFAQARLSPPSLGQIGAEAAVDTPDTYFEQVIAEYKERRDVLFEALSQIDGVICPKPSGAFYGMIELPIQDSDHFAQWLLENFSFEGATVMVAPATGFYATPGLGKNQVRIAYVLKKEELIHAAKCLKEAIKIYTQEQVSMLNNHS